MDSVIGLLLCIAIINGLQLYLVWRIFQAVRRQGRLKWDVTVQQRD